MEIIEGEKNIALENMLAQFEDKIGSRTATFTDLAHVIDALSKLEIVYKIGITQQGYSRIIATHWYTRLALAIAEFFKSWTVEPTFEHFFYLAQRKKIVSAIFMASGFAGSRFLIKYLSQGQGKVELSPQKAKILLLLGRLDDLPTALIKYAFSLDQSFKFIASMAWLTESVILTEEGEVNRKLVCDLVPSLATGDLSWMTFEKLKLISVPWMYVTYGNHKDKNKVKISLNEIIRRFLLQAGYSDLPKKANPNLNRPKVLIFNEHLKQTHAMGRCYIDPIKSLRAKFELISMGFEEYVSEFGSSVFDAEYLFPFKVTEDTLKKLLKTVQKIEPDIVFFPSVGMNFFGIILANLRIAPFQVMAYGHPASAYSDKIDLGAINSSMGSSLDSGLFLEDIAPIMPTSLLPHPSSEVAMLKDDCLCAFDTRVVNVAINSKSFKINKGVIKLLKNLEVKSSKPIHLHFFPSERGISQDALRHYLEGMFLRASVYPYLPFNEYFTKLLACDFAISSFPFGNTNGTVDLLCAGKTVLAFSGDDISSATDRCVLSLVPYQQDFIFTEIEDLEQKALFLIDNPQELGRNNLLLSSLDVKEIMSSQSVQKNSFCTSLLDHYAKRIAG